MKITPFPRLNQTNDFKGEAGQACTTHVHKAESCENRLDHLKMENAITKSWIQITLLSLAISGFYSIFIVLLRSPYITEFFPDKSIFQTALIVHVDLSVLFWMICFIMMIISTKLDTKYDSLVKVLQKLVTGSIILIFVSPIIPDSTPYMNNYIPILHNLLFIIGIAFFMSVFFVFSCIATMSEKSISMPIGIAGIIMFLSFFISGYKLSEIDYPIDQYNYYEMLFWAGGHILQFIYCAGLIVVWLKMTSKKESIKPLLWLNCLLILPLPIIQLFIKIDGSDYFSLFTEHMKIFGGIAPICTLLVIFIEMIISKDFRYKQYFVIANSKESIKNYSFILSLSLFFYGGIIALMVSGLNVTIPAHYHGSIVSISIAFMGYIYLTIDRYYSIINFKHATIQLITYALGQTMHISALAYSGGYGALRKTPGVDLALNAKIAMGFMGAGGLIAIVAGLIFVYICSKPIFFTNHKKET